MMVYRSGLEGRRRIFLAICVVASLAYPVGDSGAAALALMTVAFLGAGADPITRRLLIATRWRRILPPTLLVLSVAPPIVVSECGFGDAWLLASYALSIVALGALLTSIIAMYTDKGMLSIGFTLRDDTWQSKN